MSGQPGWRELSDGSGMFSSSGDAQEDARFEQLHRRWQANEAEGLCPNGCGPLQWLDAHNTHCPTCKFSGWSNVPNKGRVFTDPEEVTIANLRASGINPAECGFTDPLLGA